jgi:hypothetical protein
MSMSIANRVLLLPRQQLAPWTGRRMLAAAAILLGLLLVGVAIPFVPAELLLAGAVALALVIAVVAYPPVAAYALIGITPLVAGIDRGRIVPALRPAEVLAVLAAGGLILRGLFGLRIGGLPHLHLGKMDLSILLVAVTSSVVPLAWMLARSVSITSDDMLYALMIWKYYGLYLIVRCSVGTQAQVRRCLWISVVSATAVAGIAILQSLQLFGVPRLLESLFTPYGDASQLTNNRGGATLSLPIAVADLMILNLAIIVGFLLRGRAHRRLLLLAALAMIAGVLASGQFSGILALFVALGALAMLTRRARIIAAVVPAMLVAGFLLRSVIGTRLLGFQSTSGIPISWQGRWYNLTNYFWPSLFSHWNFLLGVRVSARVSASTIASGYVWIESGYTWLLWAGGIPLLGAFLYFLWVNLRSAIPRSREADAVGVAALAAATGLIVVAALMTIDPHLTYRGSADLLFALLALTLVGGRIITNDPAERRAEIARSGRS